MAKILNLGCGINRLTATGEPFPDGTIHIDKNEAVKPDITHDLNEGLPCGPELYPLWENHFDEIHAYHLIEHIGKMGDTKEWFRFWRDCWIALKPYGRFYLIAPHWLNEDSIGDPTHTRQICRQTFVFLKTESGWKLIHEHGTIKQE